MLTLLPIHWRSEATFLAALEEEAAAAREFFGDSEAEAAGDEDDGKLPSVEEAVAAIRKGEDGAINWALFSVNA